VLVVALEVKKVYLEGEGMAVWCILNYKICWVGVGVVSGVYSSRIWRVRSLRRVVFE
jgi:hypothetical protein